MSLMSFVRALCVMLGALIVTANVAHAGPAFTPTDVYMRKGPGAIYPILETIPGGSVVHTGKCISGWCQVHWSGRTGYVFQTSLQFGAYSPKNRPSNEPPAPIEEQVKRFNPRRYYGSRPYYDPYWHNPNQYRGPRNRYPY